MKNWTLTFKCRTQPWTFVTKYTVLPAVAYYRAFNVHSSVRTSRVSMRDKEIN